MLDKEISQLIEQLKGYDNRKGYKLSYEEVKNSLENTINKLAKCGEPCLDYLHPLLEHEETWSSTFALKVLREIKSEKSVPHLIKFIKDNEKGDYGDYAEDAMFALNEIGEPAIKPLIKEVRTTFDEKEFYFYLIGALTEIKDERVYLFMTEIVKDYIKNEEKYDEWFCINAFVSDFKEQGKKEILLLLKEVLSLDRLSRHEKIEIRDTIKIIEDPEGWRKEVEESREKWKPVFEEIMKKEKKPYSKLSEKEKEKIQEMMQTPDEDFETQFKCIVCNKKQKPGSSIYRTKKRKSWS